MKWLLDCVSGTAEQCEVVAAEHIYSLCQFGEDALCLLRNAEVLLILGAQGCFGLVCLQVCFRIIILQTAVLCKKAPIQVCRAKVIRCVPRAEINIALLFFQSR